ncbi:hypothetical protein FB561_2221 [Kribbella amoyensis]|uniref:YacP-like NYN domain-containing protein n=1 Tax=Kribbella amoyensis TaxID=996641 RepID=A0A561BQH7_9ACTN|nr:hypothetical protein [Kribbella amoyensis]TWD81117.1 hypothetical protein FB561_2221 [Kribbella amoyensis]
MNDDRQALVVVDAANVIGSRPNGWWRDRAGAARRLLASLTEYHQSLAVPHPVTVILEGQARAAAPDPADHATGDGQREADGVEVVVAEGSGDDTIVDVVRRAADHEPARPITVVTADRGLRARVEALGATTVGPSWLWDRLP